MHSIAGPYTKTHTQAQMFTQRQSCSLAQQLSGQVFLLQGISNMSRSHTHTYRSSHKNTQTCTYKQPDTHKLEMMAICSATFHWDMCAHSNQESRHSGTLRLRQLLVSTGKMCAGEFSAVLFMMQMSQLRVFTFSFNHGWIGPRKTRLDRDFLVLDSEHWLQPNSFYTHFGSDPHADLNGRGSHL